MLVNITSDSKADGIFEDFSNYCCQKDIDVKKIVLGIQNDFYIKCSYKPGHIIPIGEVYPGNWDGTNARHIWNYACYKNRETADRSAGANYLPYIIKSILLKDNNRTYTFFDNKSKAVYRKGRTRTGYLLVLDDEELLFNDLAFEETKQLIQVMQDSGRITADEVKILKGRLGHKCEVCGFDFEAHYADLGKEFIELHHLFHRGKREISSGKIKLTSNDFSVLCSNCHKMIHRLKNPKYNQDDVKTLRNIYKK